MVRILCGLVGLLLAFPALADDNAALFGSLPRTESLSLSPDGKHLAYLQRSGDATGLVIRDLDDLSGKPVMANVSGNKIRDLEWANDRFVLLWTSKTAHSRDFRADKVEFGGVYAFDRESGKIEQLLARERTLAANSDLGEVVGVLPGENQVLMPAYRRTSTDDREYVLYKVDLETNRARVEVEGFGNSTQDFIVDAKGQVRARVNYVAKLDRYRLQAYRAENKSWDTILETEVDRLPFGIKGVSGDGKSLILSGYMDGDTNSLYLMSLADGQITGPFLQRKDSDIETILAPVWNNGIAGVGFANVKGTQYSFLDEQLQASWKKIQTRLPDILVDPLSWTPDGQTWLLFAYDEMSAGKYLIYHASDDSLSIIADNHGNIPADKIGRQFTVNFHGADGLALNGVLTTPPGFEKGPVPMVVLPHGGPASHDSMGWDWMAQYLANEGYLVMQPNYRGSDGFGYDFEHAADGKWGTALLDDINQGARAIIKAGYADPDRICIAGASFGGFAALAEVTIANVPYQCAVSISGVANQQHFLNYVSHAYGYESMSSDIWRERMTGPDQSVSPDSISPEQHASAAIAPILLIHGKDDTVVPYDQSTGMKRALEQAGKPVQLVTLDGEDHWLSKQETRVETLSAMGAFLRKYLRAEPVRNTQPSKERE